MINENEIYSCGQLDFFNALSPSDKLKLQETATNHQQQSQQQQSGVVQPLSAYNDPSEQLPQVKLERAEFEIDTQLLDDLQKSNGVRDAKTSAAAANELPEVLFKRVAQKANPKTVTASVFKAIPVGGANKLLKPISGGHAFAAGTAGSATTTAAAALPSTTIGGARAPQSVTASLIQPIASIKRDLFGKSQASDRATAAEPSVVTASLFQPRTNAIGGANAAFGTKKLCNNISSSGASATSIANTAANQLASRTEAMNKPFLMFTDDIRQLTSEYFCSSVQRATTDRF